MNSQIETNKEIVDLSDLAIRADLADYSPVRGCMVIKPYGYSIWELIQKELDARIKECGHQNAYFPLFIPESFIKKEADHIDGFAPECAVVTHAGGQKLEEPLVVRPTSETIIYHMFSKWIRSWRDLPYSINQWANVVRWEMRTRLFLRTTEFLWQEGHTAHATAEDANREARRMLNVYYDLMTNILALSPVVGEKTDSERFAGAHKTYSLEILLRDGKILQAGTSHHLGQGFAEAFGIKYQNKDNQLESVHLTSWGVSTRLIGAIILGHQDDKGLILPPRVAPFQVVIIPIYKNEEQKTNVMQECDQIFIELKQLGIRVKFDDNDQITPGAKFNNWELKGVPLRVQVGPRDVENKVVELARRDTQTKLKDIPRIGLGERINVLLDDIQDALLERNKQWREENTRDIDSFDDINKVLDEKGGFLRAHWCGSAEHEAQIKEKTKATIRIKPFEAIDPDGKCIVSGSPSPSRVYIGRAY
ncbi:MAG: proline--tRNA ligase [Candidatus Caenarcaniphilales bacterium]|nr:proline--tRNA ligase [Candidatus Caenarcaniphilales bacterium]